MNIRRRFVSISTPIATPVDPHSNYNIPIAECRTFTHEENLFLTDQMVAILNDPNAKAVEKQTVIKELASLSSNDANYSVLIGAGVLIQMRALLIDPKASLDLREGAAVVLVNLSYSKSAPLTVGLRDQLAELLNDPNATSDSKHMWTMLLELYQA